MADGWFEPRSQFAGLNALVPRVFKLVATSPSTVSEPRTTATATTHFARFFNGTAFRTHRTHGRRGDCWCLYMQDMVKTTNEKTL